MISPLIGEYQTITDLGADLIAISADDVESHAMFCESLGGCPFPLASDPGLVVAREYGVVGEDGRRANRAVFVVDESGAIVHKIPWYQPGNVGQFMEIFNSLGLE